MARGVTARRWVIDRRARLLAGLVAALGLGFLLLAFALRGAPGTGLDLAITLAVQRVRTPVFAQLMVAISALGFWPWDWLILGATTAGFWLGGFRRAALFLLATPAPGLVTRAIKLLVGRPRPEDDAINVASALRDFSFPSGHVVSYVSLYGMVFFLVYVLFKRSRWRTTLLWLCGLLIGLVGISRVYLGHHWASDVLGGYALGSASLLILIEVYRLTTIKPAVETTPALELAESLGRRPP